MASVIVVNKHSSREVALSNAVTVVGRDGGVSLELGDLQVSRRHALLVQARQGYFVKDLGSRNGILVNKQRVGSRMQVPIRNGDVLNLGRTTLIFKDLGAAAAGDDEEHEPTLHKVPVSQEAPTRPAPQPVTFAPEAEEAETDEAPLELAEEPAPRAAPPPPPPRRPAPKAKQEIPRAMAPGAAVYSGQAELLALRALVERAERDRAYYRNLSLILFVLLVGILIAVFVWAMLDGRSEQPSETPVPPSAPAPSAPVAKADLDAEVFAARVQPILSAHCASCHATVGEGGNLEIASSNDPHTVEANLSAVSRFVRPGDPERSALLLAPLSPEEGGTEHGGGAVLTMDSTDWQTLRAWVVGEDGAAPAAPTTSAVAGEPPSARIDAATVAVVGDAIALDATNSSDPEGAPLTYRWTLVNSPAGATSAIDGADRDVATLTPDEPGEYVVALVVRDGAATGSTEHTLVVEPKVDPSREAGLRRASEALLGRRPTVAEQDELGKLKGEQLVARFLEQDELYQRWWNTELQFLGLTGANKPSGEPWDSLPRRLKTGKYTVANAYYALLVGQNWSARYSGRDAYVNAVLEKVLGPQKRQDPALREAGGRLYDGHESTLLGKRTKGQVGLVKVAVNHPEAVRYLLWRTYRGLFHREPTNQVLDLATQRLRERPSEFFRQLAEWACRGL